MSTLFTDSLNQQSYLETRIIACYQKTLLLSTMSYHLRLLPVNVFGPIGTIYKNLLLIPHTQVSCGTGLCKYQTDTRSPTIHER